MRDLRIAAAQFEHRNADAPFNLGRIHALTAQAVERGAEVLLRQVAAIGTHSRDWSRAMVQARGVEGVRVLVGFKSLAGKHSTEEIERACQTALTYGAYRLRTIRQLLVRQAPPQTQFDFLDEHPVIRPLADYSLDSLLQFRKEQ